MPTQPTQPAPLKGVKSTITDADCVTEKAGQTPTPRALWRDALRSGEYEQTTGQLTEGGAYCCLGVLCELYCQHVENIRHGDEYAGESHVLPEEVEAWAGLTDCTGQGLAINAPLTVLNDDHGYTFEQLAGELDDTRFKP